MHDLCAVIRSRRNPPRDRTLHQLAFPARRRIIGAHSAHPLCVESQLGVNIPKHSKKSPHAVARVVALVLLVATLAARAVVATTFMSVSRFPVETWSANLRWP